MYRLSRPRQHRLTCSQGRCVNGRLEILIDGSSSTAVKLSSRNFETVDYNRWVDGERSSGRSDYEEGGGGKSRVPEGDTPLHLAAFGGSQDCCKIVLSYQVCTHRMHAPIHAHVRTCAHMRACMRTCTCMHMHTNRPTQTRRMPSSARHCTPPLRPATWKCAPLFHLENLFFS